MNNNLKVFINKTNSGILSFENEQYVFNYKESVSDVVSLTIPIRSASWNSKNLHPIFHMIMTLRIHLLLQFMM